jgi:hypothetical protein
MARARHCLGSLALSDDSSSSSSAMQGKCENGNSENPNRFSRFEWTGSKGLRFNKKAIFLVHDRDPFSLLSAEYFYYYIQ